MGQQNFHRKVKVFLLLTFLSSCVIAQVVAPFSALPDATTCDTSLDRLIYLQWNGSKFVDKK